ncbi:MAG: GGDEF domain-containing protein [Nitrospinota bacterium]
MDFATGARYSVSLLYAIPIFIGPWYGSNGVGFAAAGAAAISKFADDVIFHYGSFSDPSLYWDLITWTAFFTLTVGMAATVRQALDSKDLLANTDPLTGLANRRYFLDRLETELARARRYPRPFALMYVDLDNFKAVNDAQGHAAGDAALRAVAGVLRANTRAVDTAARLGGDEFACLFPETDHPAMASAAAKIHPLLLGSMTEARWPITFSIGVTTFENPPSSAEEALKAADGLMYSVKRATKNAILHEHWSGPAAPGSGSAGITAPT